MAVSRPQIQQRIPFVDGQGRLSNEGLRAINDALGSLFSQIQQIAELYGITDALNSDLAGIAGAPAILADHSASFPNGRKIAGTAPIGITDGGAGGPLSVSLADTAVSPGTFGSASQVASFTVDGKGRLTFAGNVAITAAAIGAVSSVDASGGTTGLTFSGGPITSSGTLTLGGTLGVSSGGTGATTQGGARTSLGLAIGSDVQAYSAKLAAYAGGDTPSAFVLGIVDSVDAVAFRSAIGAGTSSTTGTVTSVQASGGTTGLSFSGGPITGAGTLTLGGTLALASGGTGATTAAGARTNLGLGTAAVENYSTGTWTPTISAGSGTITTASATGAYTRIGRLVVINVAITITTNGTGGTFVAFTLPFAAAADSSGCGRETAVTGDMLQAFLAGGTSSAFIQRYDTAYPGADGRTLKITAAYYV